MKIAELKTFVVGNPPPAFGGRYFLFLKLKTACGIEGVGEVYAASFAPEAIVKMIEDVFTRHVEGADPFRIETLVAQRLWPRLFGPARHFADGRAVGRRDGALGHRRQGGGQARLRARSAARCTSGCAATPISIRTSPARTPIPTVRFIPILTPRRSARSNICAQGFTAVKFDPAGPYSTFDPRQPSLERLELCEAFCRTLREAVGTKCDLLFGTHGQFTVSGALRLARRIEPYEPLWFEEPTPPEAPEEMARVAAQCRMPIATGERLTTKYEFARVLETGAASILQMNLGRVGGILEAKKIAGMAEAHYAQIAPHLYCGPVVGAANVQLATCSPNFLILESIERWDGFHGEILKKPIRWEDGFVIPPDEPGLGVELNEEVALAHPWTGNDLHLMPRSAPVWPPE